jgi:AcrR family transcriptional regulator
MILQGAAGVFAERGIRAASVEDILKASRVSRRTFYRFYQSKEDVMVALYSLGTEVLLVGCRFAMEHETDALQQVLQGFEVHLRNARDVGRLVFVLGGEAHRQESPLHARRMHVHAELVGLFVTGAERSGQRADPLLYRALILALEGVTRFVLEECDEGRAVTDAGIDKARQVMARLAISAVGGNGPGATPGPQPPRRQRASRPPR